MTSTVEYLKSRKQFGVPIGNFQVLQHRAADMLIALEQARSMALFAAMMADDADPGRAAAGAYPRRKCRSDAPAASSASRRSSCTAASA